MSRFIMTVEHALKADTCADIVRRIDADPRAFEGTTGAGLDYAHKKSRDLDIDKLPDWAEPCRALQTSLTWVLERYADANPSLHSVTDLSYSGLRVRRYDREDFFDWHIDTYDSTVARRVLAVIWYLNDVADGGATEFLHQEESIAPKTGTAILFPTGFEYVHRSTPIVAGAKYIALTFAEHAGVV